MHFCKLNLSLLHVISLFWDILFLFLFRPRHLIFEKNCCKLRNIKSLAFCEPRITFFFLTWNTIIYFLHFTWNVIARFFPWTWRLFSNFPWCVKGEIFLSAWFCYKKGYRGPSIPGRFWHWTFLSFFWTYSDEKKNFWKACSLVGFILKQLFPSVLMPSENTHLAGSRLSRIYSTSHFHFREFSF